MFFGLIIIIIGLVFLLKNLGLIGGDVWPIIWPSLVIVIGLSFIFKKRKQEKKWYKFGEDMRKFGEEMHKRFTDKDKND